jgi:hypothetical protein
MVSFEDCRYAVRVEEIAAFGSVSDQNSEFRLPIASRLRIQTRRLRRSKTHPARLASSSVDGSGVETADATAGLNVSPKLFSQSAMALSNNSLKTSVEVRGMETQSLFTEIEDVYLAETDVQSYQLERI